ncbi:hypothetical protein L1887_47035 [Cichorium endivia]|nr:hypothetical protein L1887_47035 [Cichorium endivia]
MPSVSCNEHDVVAGPIVVSSSRHEGELDTLARLSDGWATDVLERKLADERIVATLNALRPLLVIADMKTEPLGAKVVVAQRSVSRVKIDASAVQAVTDPDPAIAGCVDLDPVARLGRVDGFVEHRNVEIKPTDRKALVGIRSSKVFGGGRIVTNSVTLNIHLGTNIPEVSADKGEARIVGVTACSTVQLVLGIVDSHRRGVKVDSRSQTLKHPETNKNPLEEH